MISDTDRSSAWVKATNASLQDELLALYDTYTPITPIFITNFYNPFPILGGV